MKFVLLFDGMTICQRNNKIQNKYDTALLLYVLSADHN